MTAEQRATDRQPPLRRPQLPRGWRRRLARLPLGLYRVGLGFLFGKRLLLLHHTGRVSGLDRTVVLEVVAHDPEQGSWTLASGFGPDIRLVPEPPQAPRPPSRSAIATTPSPPTSSPRPRAVRSWPATRPAIHARPAACARSWASTSTAAWSPTETRVVRSPSCVSTPHPTGRCHDTRRSVRADDVWQRFLSDSEQAIRHSAPREPSAEERAAPPGTRHTGIKAVTPATTEHLRMVGEPWQSQDPPGRPAWRELDAPSPTPSHHPDTRLRRRAGGGPHHRIPTAHRHRSTGRPTGRHHTPGVRGHTRSNYPRSSEDPMARPTPHPRQLGGSGRSPAATGTVPTNFTEQGVQLPDS